jgi:ribosomal protein L30E
MSLREDLKKKKPILRLKSTLKAMHKGKAKKVYVTTNSHMKNELANLGKSLGVPVEIISENNKELAILVKKPFAVSVVAFD